jgi:capsular exopolysaccharide synthesis family protein
MGGEGKTTLTTQLAMSLARTERAAVLVDFDLRRPAFDEVFGLPLKPGVSEFLRGESSIDDVVQSTAANDLSVVTAGRWDRHALTALANGTAGMLFDQLREKYDFVLVDASPVLPVADVRFVSQHVDAVILSVLRDVSQAPKITASCEILRAFGVQVLEAVVTGPSEGGYYRDLGYEPRLPAS